MAYNINQLVTVGQYKALAEKMKGALDTAIAALPVEKFLDQLNTKFVPSFTFNASTYTGATDPSLNGKPVFVLAVKGVDNSISYSFCDMSTLVDTYTVKAGNSAKILNISGYEIEVKIDPSKNNAIQVTADGLIVDVTGKADKLSSATNDNIFAMDANGNLKDSGISKGNIIQTSNVATDAETAEVLTEIFG